MPNKILLLLNRQLKIAPLFELADFPGFFMHIWKEPDHKTKLK